MLDVRNRPVLVIGGDAVAAEKATNLSSSGASVTVQNLTFCDELLDLEHRKRITLRHKVYEAGDLAGAFVVVAATTYNTELSEAIWHEAQERGQLVNIVDVPSRCNFILPSILRRGKLTISVSTEGASPSIAKRIRQNLEEQFPAVYATYLHLAGIARTMIKQQGLSYAQRDEFFKSFFEADILERLLADDQSAAVASTVHLLRLHSIEISTTTLLNELKEAEAHYEHFHFR